MTQINSNLSSLLATSLGKTGRGARYSSLRPNSNVGMENGLESTTASGPGTGHAQETRFVPQFSTGRDVANAVSFGQTQAAYLKLVDKALDRMSDLAAQAQNIGKTPAQLELYQQEFAKLGNYIKSVAGKDFNGISLFSSPPPGAAKPIAGGPSMPAVNLKAKIYPEAIDSSVADPTRAKHAADSIQAARLQLSTDQASVAARVETLFSISEDLSQLEAAPSSNDANNQEVENRWVDSLSMYQMFAQPGMALLTQANVNPRAVSRLLS